MVLSHPLRAVVILDLFGAFGQERIDTLMFLTKASEDEIRGVEGGCGGWTLAQLELGDETSQIWPDDC